MSAPYFGSFEACSTCTDEERCWYFGRCLGKMSQAEKEKMEGDLSQSITNTVKNPVGYSYPGPYSPGDYMPDGRHMASLEKGRSKD